MGQSELQPEAADPTERADDAWVQSLRELLLDVIASLPDHATLGELIAAIRSNPAMSPVLDIFTVQELIDAARKRPVLPPKAAASSGKPAPREVQFDADGNPVLDLGDPGALVIRRRADVPDGDIRVLRCLSERGPLREAELTSVGGLTSEQLRILLRNLKSKGFVHVEGSGLKRRLKITRQGAAFLRKQG